MINNQIVTYNFALKYRSYMSSDSTTASVDFAKSDDFVARSFYRWHGILAQPAFRVCEYFMRWGNPLTPNIFDNCTTKVREFAYRAFGPTVLVGLGAAAYLLKTSLLQIGLFAAGSLGVFGIGMIALQQLGAHFQNKNYIHVRGEAKEVETLEPKILSWNIFGFPAGLNYTCGGCIPFRKRFPEIEKLIKDQSAEIVILQECLMDASVTEMFVDAFKDQYAHLFIHNGPASVLRGQLESGLLVMSKYPVEDYSFTPFNNTLGAIRRGFVTLKVKAQDGRPSFAVIGTHMASGYSVEDAKARKEQLAQIRDHANQLKDVAGVFLAGDLNIDAQRDPEKKELSDMLDPVHEDRKSVV